MITLAELFHEEENPFEVALKEENALYNRLGAFLEKSVSMDDPWKFYTYTTFKGLGSVHFFFKNPKAQTIAVRVTFEEIMAFQIRETAVIAKEAYEAGHKECLEYWSESEGIRVKSYDEYYEGWEHVSPPRDSWIADRLTSINAGSNKSH